MTKYKACSDRTGSWIAVSFFGVARARQINPLGLHTTANAQFFATLPEDMQEISRQ